MLMKLTPEPRTRAVRKSQEGLLNPKVLSIIDFDLFLFELKVQISGRKNGKRGGRGDISKNLLFVM